MPLRSATTKSEIWRVGLTAEERHGVELVPPFVGDFDLIHLALLSARFVALLVGIIHHFLDMVWVDCVQDVEVVIPVRVLAFREATRHKAHHFNILHVPGTDILDAQLVKLWNVDLPESRHLDQIFLLGQDFPHEVLGHHPVGRQVPLHYSKL